MSDENQTEYSESDLTVNLDPSNEGQVNSSASETVKNFPSKESAIELHIDFNNAVDKFVKANLDSEVSNVMKVILHTMFQYPWSWMKLNNSENHFTDAISMEALTFAYLMQQRELADLKNEMASVPSPVEFEHASDEPQDS